MTNLTTELTLANDQWYSLVNSGLVPIHYKQVLTSAADPVFGSDATLSFRHTLHPHDKADFYKQESGVELWAWVEEGRGIITLSEAQ